jgi:hypothetical protein
VRKLLERNDNFAIPTMVPSTFRGAKSHANFIAALVSDYPTAHESWAWLLQFARDAFIQGRRLLLAAENFASIFRLPERIELLIKALREVGYRTVRVVVTHRRVYEKLQSEHSEQFMAEHRCVPRAIVPSCHRAGDGVDLGRAQPSTYCACCRCPGLSGM